MVILFFYTGNGLATYLFKLAHDGDYVPTEEEFYADMKAKRIPIQPKRFITKTEIEYAGFDVQGKEPKLGDAGFKLAHLIDANKDYLYAKKIIKWQRYL